MDNCSDVVEPAISEISSEYEIRAGDGVCTVVTPFQHWNGDLITLHISSKEEDKLEIRDYGETFSMLRLYGVDPTADSRRGDIQSIKSQFNLISTAGEIALTTTENELHRGILNAVQAIQATSYLIYKHRSQQPSQFTTKVVEFLRESGYDCEPGFETQGVTQTRRFDISINHRHPAVLLDTIHTNDEGYLQQQVDSVLVNWYEIEDADYSHGAVIDDVDGIAPDDIVGSLESNLDYVFRWEQKNRIPEEIPVNP